MPPPLAATSVRCRRLQGSEGVLPTDWLLSTPSLQSSEALFSGLQATAALPRFRGPAPVVRADSAVAPAAPPRAAQAPDTETRPQRPPVSSTPSLPWAPPPGNECSVGQAAPPAGEPRGSKGAVRSDGSASPMTSRRALDVLQHMPTAALLRLPLELNSHHGQHMRRGFYKPRPAPTPQRQLRSATSPPPRMGVAVGSWPARRPAP